MFSAGGGSSYYVGAVSAERVTAPNHQALTVVVERLGAIQGRLAGVAGALHSTADRVFGTRPESPSDGNLKAASPSASLHEISERLDGVMRLIESLENAAERLNNL